MHAQIIDFQEYKQKVRQPTVSYVEMENQIRDAAYEWKNSGRMNGFNKLAGLLDKFEDEFPHLRDYMYKEVQAILNN